MKPPDKPVFGVTGANGYVGSCLVASLRKQGYEVFKLQRRKDPDDKFAVPYSLESGCDPQALSKIDWLVHAAYDFTLTEWEKIDETNVRRSAGLFDAARQAGVRGIIFISSIASFEQAKSLYGKAKFLTEKEAAARGAIVLRPGLIYGRTPGGVFGSLKKMASNWPCVPLIGSGRQMLPLLHEDDFCEVVRRLAVSGVSFNGPVFAAEEERCSLADIMKILVARTGKTKRMVPVPAFLILAGLKLAEALRIPVGFRSDSLISILNQNPNLDFRHLRSLEIVLRKFGPSNL